MIPFIPICKNHVYTDIHINKIQLLLDQLLIIFKKFKMNEKKVFKILASRETQFNIF